MALELDIQSLLDIGLVLLLAFGAFQLFASKSGGASDATRATWKGELTNLEESLRELIGEASAASRNLDRNLLQRKRELESLLKDLDASEQRATQSATTSDSVEVDLPNETWAEAAPSAAVEKKTAPAKTKTPSRKASSSVTTGYGAGGIAKKSPAAKEVTPQAALEKVVSSAGGTMALSQQVTKEVLRQQAQKRGAGDKEHAASQELADKLEEANERMVLDESERITFESTSIMDPVTYRIARRLIVSGKEIHVVARKLDLPVSEIRLLDRLIRRETQGEEQLEDDAELQEETLLDAPISQESLAARIESSNSPLAPSRGEGSFTAGMGRFESEALFDPKEAQPFVTEHIAEVKEVTSSLSVANDLDQDIERELALL